MLLYKTILKQGEQDGPILTYQPRAFPQHVPDQALPFVKDQNAPPVAQFELNKFVAETTGVNELEKKKFQERVEYEVLQRLKAVEEKAFQEAYALGLSDGKTKAYKDSTDEIKESVSKLQGIITSLTELKGNMLLENEQHLIHTLFHFAKALALKEIKQDPASLLPVIRKAIESAQGEEEVVIKINPQDMEFLESVKIQAGNPVERLSRVKMEVLDSITRGGCVVETNYGVIDATIEQRVQKLWGILESKTPKVAGQES